MAVKTSANLVHNAVCNQAELTRQTSVAAATSQSAVRAADLVYYRALFASSRTNNNSADISMIVMALKSLGVTA
jgi:hypothetical protein